MGISLSGLSSGMDTDAIIKELMKVQSMKVDKLTKAKSKIEMKKEVWSSVNTKILKFYNGSLNNLRMQGTFMSKKVEVLNQSVGSATATINAANGTHDFHIKTLATGSSLTSKETIEVDIGEGLSIASATTLLSELNLDTESKSIVIKSTKTGESKTIDIDLETESLGSLARKIAEADSNLLVSYEEKYGRFMIRSKETGKEHEISLTVLKEDGTVKADSNLFDILKLDTNLLTDGTLTATAGTDAEFTYNGVEGLFSSSNQIEIGGITFNAYKANEHTSVVVSSNTEEVYKAVKDFIKEYNEVLEELNNRAYSGVAKGYEPLTKEEKSQMSETDIKLWEDAVKNGLLNRDSTAIELIDIMRNVMTSNSGVDTSKLVEPYTTLSSLGISTFVWQERGLLHIDGDTEDAVGAMNDDKLRKAIEENPEAVMKLLNGLGSALSDQLGKKMSSVSNVKSAFTFYNDKVMDKEIEAKAEEIKIMQDRIFIIEERYRRQFAAMEKAMSVSNATSAWLTQMLGQ